MKSVDLALGSDVPQFYIGFSKSATIFVILKKYFPAKSRLNFSPNICIEVLMAGFIYEYVKEKTFGEEKHGFLVWLIRSN